jgi:uncharacterized protein
MRLRFTVLMLATSLLTVACFTDDAAVVPDSTPPTVASETEPIEVDAAPTTAAAPAPDPALDPATFDVVAGTEQITITGATPGDELTATPGDGTPAATGIVDEFGALLFRNLTPGTEFTVRNTTSAAPPVTTLGRTDHPDQAWYAAQRLEAPGFGYLTTRDGTTLSVTVWLPGPADGGPYPTVVEYSGYSPSDPASRGLGDIYTALGYAYVGVNMRGTGCSGGSYRFFEYAQSLDGYDAVEAVAAQPWVLRNEVAMVGVSYPGISQLFVARTQPPSLAAITPLSVLDDSALANLYPGGILNTGFAVDWTRQRVEEARPEGQRWAAERIADGDEQCARNQLLRLQNPDLLAEIRANPFSTEPLASDLAPRTFVDQITVPVFLAGAWQDEQTGGRFPTMLDRFTGTPHLYVSLVNGLHTESVSPAVLVRALEFLELYLARRTPELSVLPAIAPILGAGIFGTSDLAVTVGRFDGMSYDDALAAFESEPPIQVLFEQGAADGFPALSPMPRFVAAFDTWPVPGAVATAWYLDTGDERHGRLVADVPTTSGGESTYLALPDAIPATYYSGSSSAIWRTDVVYDWQQPPPGTAVSFLTAPLGDDTVVVGSGSVDVWLRSNLGDTDLEVTVSEVRPDGDEVYVQSGWLRASHRALDAAASNELRPVHTHREADAMPLPGDRFEPVRIEIFPVAHAFRAGSQIRLTIDAPGGARPTWAFETIAGGEEVTIAHDRDHPSRLVLPVVDDIVVPAGLPPCDSLRGQPCRRFAN